MTPITRVKGSGKTESKNGSVFTIRVQLSSIPAAPWRDAFERSTSVLHDDLDKNAIKLEKGAQSGNAGAPAATITFQAEEAHIGAALTKIDLAIEHANEADAKRSAEEDRAIERRRTRDEQDALDVKRIDQKLKDL